MSNRMLGYQCANKRHAFSLVELSIVLVILGLLVGGILAGQSLIRAAELRSVTTDYTRYITALNTFRDQYFAIPGDMANATSFWGATPSCPGTAGTGTQTCNGDGNMRLSYTGAASEYVESFMAWQHFKNAGLIEGNYTGIAGAGASYDTVLGTNVPTAKITNTGWSFYDLGTYAGGANAYAATYNNVFTFGSEYGGLGLTDGSGLEPKDAWNIDTKLDDGKPGTGKVIARDNGGFGNAAACTTSTSATDYAGTYKLSNTDISCAFYMPLGF